MESIEFECPECGQVLEAPEDMAGEAIDCPSCEATITIPHPELGDARDALAIPALEGNEPYTETATNVCPGCNATLAAGTVLCVHCGFHQKLGKKISTEFD